MTAGNELRREDTLPDRLQALLDAAVAAGAAAKTARRCGDGWHIPDRIHARLVAAVAAAVADDRDNLPG